jgi:RimJ/RimL family protein N-acetyltransferase
VAESCILGSAFAVVHRRRGIATALKRAQISWAAANGYRELVTSSVEAYEAMRSVNERLGFRPPAWSVVQGPAR